MGGFGGQTLEDLRSDPALRIGLAGGALATAVALVGYALLPAIDAGNANVFEVIVEVAIGSIGLSRARHAAVLLATPFVLALAGTLLARRRGLTGRSADAKVVGGIVVAPMVAVCALYVVSAVGFGATFGSGGGSLGTRLGVAIAFTLWSLLFGLIALVAWLAIVTVAEAAGAVAGYLVARAIGSMFGDRPRPAQPPAGERD